MKTPKIIMACMAITLCTNLLFAVQPNKVDAATIARKMVAKLSKDITLTDSQKVYVLNKATDFHTKTQNANSKTDIRERNNLKKQAFESYRNILDSVLTTDQKNKLLSKQTEQMNKIINKHKSNK